MAVAWAVLGFLQGAALFAQGTNVANLFPDAARVVSAYPDNARRFAALFILYRDLVQVAPVPADVNAKGYSYEVACSDIAAAELSNGGEQGASYQDFNTRSMRLVSDAGFGRTVLEHFRVAQLPKLRPPPATFAQEVAAPAGPSGPGSPTDAASAAKLWGGIVASAVRRSFLFTLPFFGMTLGLMGVASWLVLKGSGIGTSVLPVPAPVPGDLPALPPALQVVSLPGVRYSVYALSGMVLEKESSTRTSTQTSVTGGTAYQSGGQIYSTPVQAYTTTTTTREDTFWVRTPDNREAPWTIYNGNFQTRPGNIISVLVRPLKTGVGDILMAYNHTTGSLERCPALDAAHGTTRNERAQWAANIAGGWGASHSLSFYMPKRDPDGSLSAPFCLFWFFCTLALVTISFMVITPLVKSMIRKKRNAVFNAMYYPGFRQFFQQGTGALMQRFGRA